MAEQRGNVKMSKTAIPAEIFICNKSSGWIQSLKKFWFYWRKESKQQIINCRDILNWSFNK